MEKENSASAVDALVILRHKATDVCEEIYKNINEGDINAVANFDSLFCVEAELIINSRGRKYFVVYIEEAAKDNDALKKLISNGLVDKGYSNVIVKTVW